jgi:hypothetical protein
MAQQQLAPEQAYQTLYQRLHAPVFFKKLASDYGIVPQTEQEALDLLSLGGSLRQAYEADQAKQASAAPRGQSRFSNFVGEITDVTGQSSVANERLIKAAAAEAAQDPLFAQCVLTLKAARQQQLARR